MLPIRLSRMTWGAEDQSSVTGLGEGGILITWARRGCAFSGGECGWWEAAYAERNPGVDWYALFGGEKVFCLL
ncbi:hypothetical protein Ssi02_01330 [Sinosporangium siamense]|uniref:Uncharacterized protein n=1 Tax=Sinosporangium siamense TaxID=1367973 RepID=A0A919RA90_9ACTN|nr:hypothetical protein Ssi02_01330 [Sinosporangium siamense]